MSAFGHRVWGSWGYKAHGFRVWVRSLLHSFRVDRFLV